MATLSDMRSTVAGLLRGRTDVNDEIDDAIAHAIRHYSRRASWVIERRGGTITTVAGTTWYTAIDNTSGAGIESSPSGTTPTATDSLTNLLSLEYAKLEQGAIDWPLDKIDLKSFEALVEGNAVSGTPRFITHAVGQVGLWPTPSAAYTVYVNGFFKPLVPSADADESVWFDQYAELIENAAARRVATRKLHDFELGAFFQAAENEQEALLLAEGAARRTTGRTRPSAGF